jgi:RNA polymerase primary sigma factor
VDRVREALDEREVKEREVVTLRVGLDRDAELRTLQEVGDMFDLSRERIRQIESRAKEKLHTSKRAGELRSDVN